MAEATLLLGAPLPLCSSDDQRAERYERVLRAARSMLQGEPDLVARMATVASLLRSAFAYYDWVGFYRWDGRQLVVGPYQGSVACLRIPLHRGVCGAAARTRSSQLVPDVRHRPDHIACSPSTRSELVVPLLAPGGALLGVLDVDSDAPRAFREVDRRGLQRLAAWLSRL